MLVFAIGGPFNVTHVKVNSYLPSGHIVTLAKPVSKSSNLCLDTVYLYYDYVLVGSSITDVGIYLVYKPLHNFIKDFPQEIHSALRSWSIDDEIVLDNIKAIYNMPKDKKQLIILCELVPGLSHGRFYCPGYNSLFTDYCKRAGMTGSVKSNIIHLNDDHKWSFDRIADWLDTLDIDLTVKDTNYDLVLALQLILPGLYRPNTGRYICPDGESFNTIGHYITHLNDIHKWTFEQIADHIETFDVDLTAKEK